MLTRRVFGRAFRLRPCAKINAIVRYVLAVVAERCAIHLHAVCVMSNHWHVVVTGPDQPVPLRISGRVDGRGPVHVASFDEADRDPCGAVGDFMRDVHALIARHVAVTFGDVDGGLWSKDQANTVALPEPDDIIDRMAYAVCNPVKAGLVKHGASWPGVRAHWPQPATVVARPRGFFRPEDEGGSWPEVATLRMARPPGFEHLDDEVLEARVHAAIDACERGHWAARAHAGLGYLGRRAVLAQPRFATPTTPSPRVTRKPRVASLDPETRKAWWKGFKMWQAAYRRAFAAFRRHGSASPDRFPAGTFKLRLDLNVPCEPS